MSSFNFEPVRWRTPGAIPDSMENGFHGSSSPTMEPVRWRRLGAPEESDTGILEGAYNALGATGLSLGRDVTSLYAGLGALADAAGYDFGNVMRRQGQSTGDALFEAMPPAYRKSLEKRWLALPWDDPAYLDPRAVLTTTLGVLPSLGVGLGVRATAGATAKTLGATAARQATVKGGASAGTGVVLGAGQAASGAGQAADEANLSDAERRTAERTAAAIGGGLGYFAGRYAEKAFGGTVGRVGASKAGAIGEITEEAGGALGTETGKWQVGLDPDWLNIPEQAIAGGISGGLAAGALGGKGKPKAEVKPEPTGTAEQEALRARIARDKPEETPSPPGVPPEEAKKQQQIGQLTRAQETAAKRAGILTSQAAATLSGTKKAELETLAKAEQEKATALTRQINILKGPKNIWEATGQKPVASPVGEEPSPTYVTDLETKVGNLEKQVKEDLAGMIAALPASRTTARKKYDNSRSELMRRQAELSNFAWRRKSVSQPVQAAAPAPYMTPNRAGEAPLGVEPLGVIETGGAPIVEAALPREDLDELVEPKSIETTERAIERLQKQLAKAEARRREVQELGTRKIAPRKAGLVGKPGELGVNLTGRDRVTRTFTKLSAQIADLQKQIAEQTAYLDKTKTRREELLGRGEQLGLFPRGLPTTEPPKLGPNYVDLEQLEADIAEADLEGDHFPIIRAIDKSIARSQQARMAVAAREAKRAVRKAEAELPPSDATTTPSITAVGTSPEAAAMLQRVPRKKAGTSDAGPPAASTAGPGLGVAGAPAGGPGVAGAVPGPAASAQPVSAGVAAVSGPEPAAGSMENKVHEPAAPATAPLSTPKRGLDRSYRGVLKRLLGNGPANAETVMTVMRDNAAQVGDALAPMIEHIQRAFASSKTNPNTVMVQQSQLPPGIQGQYNPLTSTVTIDMAQAYNPVRAVLHELAHAATVARMRLNPAFAQALDNLRRSAASRWKLAGLEPSILEVPGFQNAEEFVAEVMGNKEFQNKLAMLREENVYDTWGMWKGLLRRVFGFEPGKAETNLFNQVLETLNSPQFFDPKSQGEVLDALDAINAGDVVNLATTLATTTAYYPGARTFGGRVRASLLRWLGTDQIDIAHGEKGRISGPEGNYDIIGTNRSLVDQRDGYTAEKLAVASKVADLHIRANADHGAQPLDDIMHDSRMWSIHADRNDDDISNAVGIAKPGGLEKQRNLQDQWNKLHVDQQTVYKLNRALAVSNRDEHINQLMIAQARMMYSDMDVADTLELLINDPSREVSETHGGITIRGQRRVTPTEIGEMVAKVELKGDEAKNELIKRLNDIYNLLPDEPGPYFPLRRYGDYMVTIYTEPVTEAMTEDQLNRMADSGSRPGHNPKVDGTLLTEIVKRKDGKLDVTYQHKYVSSHDTEAEANADLADLKILWNGKGRKWQKAESAKKADVDYKTLGLQSNTIDALAEDIKNKLGDKVGSQVRDMITQYCLERLPDTSVGKSKMHAKKVQGADRDMARVMANFLHGNAHFQGQMRYGYKIAKNLGTDTRTVQKILRENNEVGRANDLQIIVDELRRRDQEVMDRAHSFNNAGAPLKFWRKSQQVASAWLITGLGTVGINATQPFIAGASHFYSRYNPGHVTEAYLKSVRDIAGPGMAATLAEGGRFAKSLGRLVTGKGLTSFRNPSKMLFEEMIAGPGISARERALIERLAKRNKISYGLAADLYNIAGDTGKFGSKAQNVVDFMVDGAFGLTQASEVANRVLTGLISIRVNYKQNEMLSDDQLVELAAADIDSTQYNYSPSNKPPAMQGEAVHGLFAFQTFAQNTLFQIGYNMLKAYRSQGATRAQALKYVGLYTGLTLATTGAMGVVTFGPIYGAGLLLMFALSIGEEDDWDPEIALRKAIGAGNDEFADWVLKGPLAKATGVDLTRMGLPQVFPIKDAVAAYTDPKADKNSIMEFLAEKGAGPFPAVAADFVSGISDILNGDLQKAFVKMTPKALFMNDIARMVQLSTQGVVTGKGEEIVGPEEISWVERAIRLAGFEPLEVARIKQANRAYFTAESRKSNARDNLIEDFARAALRHDSTGKQKALKKIREWNRARPEYGIKGSSLSSSVKNRLQSQRQVSTFGVAARSKGAQMTAREMQMLFGVR